MTVVQLELNVDVIARTLDAGSGIKIGTLAPLRPPLDAALGALDLIAANATEAATMLAEPASVKAAGG